jgi:hypothetical protein
LRPYFVTFPFSLTALQTMQQSATLHQPFFLFAVNGSSTGAFRITVKDGKSRQPNQLTSVYDSDILGTGSRPGFLRRPYFISPYTAIQVQVVDVSNAANTVTVTMIGAVSNV